MFAEFWSILKSNPVAMGGTITALVAIASLILKGCLDYWMQSRLLETQKAFEVKKHSANYQEWIRKNFIEDGLIKLLELLGMFNQKIENVEHGTRILLEYNPALRKSEAIGVLHLITGFLHGKCMLQIAMQNGKVPKKQSFYFAMHDALLIYNLENLLLTATQFDFSEPESIIKLRKSAAMKQFNDWVFRHSARLEEFGENKLDMSDLPELVKLVKERHANTLSDFYGSQLLAKKLKAETDAQE